VLARWRPLRICEVLKEGYGDVFFVGQHARKMACEMAYLARQRGFALCIEGVSNVELLPRRCRTASAVLEA
jgi:hypothetical protein